MKRILMVLAAFGLMGTALTAQEPNAVLAGTDATITLDGIADEPIWSAPEVVAHPLLNSPIGLWPDDDVDNSAAFRAVWSADGLYLFISVVDDAYFFTDNPPRGGHNDDTVEVFIDGDNSKANEYDQVNDFQFMFRGGEQSGDEVVAIPGNRSTPFPEPLGVQLGLTTNDNGYDMEIFIPAEPYGIAVGEGNLLGLEIAIDDDDGLNFGDRESQIAWVGIVNEAWRNPSFFGTVELGPTINTGGEPTARLPGGQLLGEGWESQEMFGIYNTTYWPIVNHLEHGWIAFSGGDSIDWASVYIYHFALGTWLFTAIEGNAFAYPTTYAFDPISGWGDFRTQEGSFGFLRYDPLEFFSW